MPARDSNDATWYVLRYPEDFQPRAGADNFDTDPFQAEPSPYHDEDALFYDPSRHLLELLPEPLPANKKARPPRGLAVDLGGGEIYKVDQRGCLELIRCDDSKVPFPCEPQVLAQPAGMAFDRRGYLYVADPAAHRVVVLLPEDGSVRAILHHGVLEQPIDVAVAPGGRIFVADRATGRIEMFTPRWKHAGGFDARNAAGLPATAEPIAVMISAEGTVLVADASHPRVLQFEQYGAPLADVPITVLSAQVAGGSLALDALRKAYGATAPRFAVTNCCPLDADDIGVRLAAVHRAIRVLGLSLGRRFVEEGIFISVPLDAGAPATIWHRIEVDADVPAGTSILVETYTADDSQPRPPPDWRAPRDKAGRPVPFAAAPADALVQSPPGRFLWLRVTLTSDGSATPSLRAVRVFYPRVSYLALLPPAYQRDADAGLFLQRFLGLFEHIYTGIEDRRDEFSRELNPDAAPRDVIDWLAALIDLAFDPSWPVEKRRALVGEAMQLYAARGTPRGIERYVEIYTGVRPLVMESFLERPGRPTFLGRPGAILGCGTPLYGCAPDSTPDALLYEQYAHRFRIYAYLDDPCEEAVLVPVISRIVEVNKPAHTVHEICLVYPGAAVGISASVGIGLVVGASTPGGTPLSGCDPAGSDTNSMRGGNLGVNTVLGERRPFYARERLEQL